MFLPVSSLRDMFQSLVDLFKSDLWYEFILHRLVEKVTVDDQGWIIWFLFCCHLLLMAVNLCHFLHDRELVCRIKQYLRVHANNIEL